MIGRANGSMTSMRDWLSVPLGAAFTALAALVISTPAFASTSERSVYYSYDAMGRQLSAKFDSAGGADGIANVYDGFGDLTSSTLSMGTFSKTLTSSYDVGGRRTALVHPENTGTYTFSYCYDALSRLTSVGQGTTCTTTPLENFNYGTNGLVSNRYEGAGATGVSNAGYTWDSIGRLTNQADVFSADNVSWAFTPNPASEIITEARTTSVSPDPYAYGETQSVSHDYGVNGLNEIVTNASGGTTTNLTYDGNGNLTSDGTNTYTYDVENRLLTASAGTVTVTLTYDPLGRLFEVVKKTGTTTNSDTRFVDDGDAQVLEYNSSGTVTNRYVHGSNAAADDPLVWYSGANLNTVRYLHADHLGSIVAVASSTGGRYATDSYDEYGINGSGNNTTERFGYTGQAYIPELGMYYYKARFYSPTLGRFLQTDPIGYEDQINLYEYADDDPVDNEDPTGETWVYSQSTGQMVHVDNKTGQVTPLSGPAGYSGYGSYANNPKYQSVAGKGPIPTGAYKIGPLTHHITPNAMRLSPERGTNTFGRSAFLIHGGHRNGDRTASEGCIILNATQRKTIGQSGDNELQVISGAPPSQAGTVRGPTPTSPRTSGSSAPTPDYSIDSGHITGNQMRGTRIGCDRSNGEETC